MTSISKDNHHLNIITWNVNSITIRYPLILKIIEKQSPDIFMLQETRADISTENLERLQNIGYQTFISPHLKGRNGVITLIKKGIFSVKWKIEDLVKEYSLGRFLGNIIFWKDKRIKIINCYVHQGSSYENGFSCSKIMNKAFNPKNFNEKLLFLNKLHSVSSTTDNLVIAGDLNVVYKNTDSWHYYEGKNTRDIVSFTKEERNIMSKICNNLIDWSYSLTEESYNFTWYDYRRIFQLKRGMKIDYCLISSKFLCSKYERMINYRMLKPTSDHVPLLYQIQFRENPK